MFFVTSASTMTNNSGPVTVANSVPAADPTYKNELQVFEKNLMTFMAQHGLPTENVLVPVPERVKVFGNVESVLALLDHQHKQKSVYVSKFMAAAASGLFDAALNYLWDETIFELRKRVVRYDLEYFFDLAIGNPDKRKRFKAEEDLVNLDDNELIRGASEIGLISELGYKHLDYIRYMRNWASAAHPNQNQITGLQLISWFETCVKEVITLPETNTTTQIRALLANMKAHQLDAAGAKQVSSFFVDLTTDQTNNLMAGFFGIYTNDSSLPLARDNVKLLAPALWPFVTEPTRKNFGVKYGQFVANNDAARAGWAREFLDGVGAASYIPDSIRAAEIGTALDELIAAHHGFNNFHIEPSFARRLESLIGEKGEIPAAIEERYVEVVTEVFLTNGHGVAWSAEPTYKKLLLKLNATQALLAVLSFRRVHISSKLQFSLPKQKYLELVELAKTKVTSPQGIDILTTIETYKPPLQHMRSETKLMEKVNAITKSLGF
jgi:virulence-associated protein VapD